MSAACPSIKSPIQKSNYRPTTQIWIVTTSYFWDFTISRIILDTSSNEIHYGRMRNTYNHVFKPHCRNIFLIFYSEGTNWHVSCRFLTISGSTEKSVIYYKNTVAEI
jgi:hypothetical protein